MGSCVLRKEETMNKKQRILGLLAVCFAVACGTISLFFWRGTQEKKRMTFQSRTGEEMEMVSVSDKPLQETDVVQEENGMELKSQFGVFVCGAVKKEGVYFLEDGSRIADAVAAAGGFLETADKSYHNLAAYVFDGQKLYIPTNAETGELSLAEREAAGKDAVAENGTEGSKRINLNTADKEMLMTLPGIGETKAENILLYRQQMGLFERKEELKNVSGIGEAMYERIQDKIMVE